MRKSKLSIKDLKSQISSLQDKLEREEQKLNCEIGAWVRQKTNVDSLQDFQDSFVIISRKNNTQAQSSKSLSNEGKIEEKS